MAVEGDERSVGEEGGAEVASIMEVVMGEEGEE